MVTTKELKGSRQEIVDQINQLGGHIVTALLIVDDGSPEPFVPPTKEELDQWMKEFEELAVPGPAHVDVSREAMYTRMPDE